MLFKDEHDFSLLPKIVFITVITSASLLALFLMFADQHNLPGWLKSYAIIGNMERQLILTSFLVIYILRLFVTIFVFLKRIWPWSEMIVVTALMSFVLFSLGKVGGNSDQPIGLLDYFSIFLYLFGSWLNTWSEYTRYKWKKSDENKGKPYTEGLFRYSMHINYFGDVVLFCGFALMTYSLSLLIIPLAMALNFVFYIIPRLDKYLAGKYGEEFKVYASSTKKLVPWMY